MWRLAPRNELMLRREPKSIRAGQTVRFDHGREFVTIRVKKTLSKSIEGVIMCGQHRGIMKTFELIEMVNIEEIFVFNELQELYSSMMAAEWEPADTSRTKTFRRSVPSLKGDFKCRPDQKYKRKFHFFKILGKGQNILCERTTARGKRCMRKTESDAWRKRWKDLTVGARFSTFIAAWIGSAIIKVGVRHLMKKTPR